MQPRCDTRKPPRKMNIWRAIAGTILLAVVALGCILGGSLLLASFSVQVPDRVLSLDIAGYRAIAGLNDHATVATVLFALFNDPGLDYTLAIAACLGYVWWRRRKDMLWAVAAIILTLVVGSATMPYMQWFGFRPRPFTIVTDVAIDPYWRQVWGGIPTFPSGHVRELTGLCVVLGYFWRSARWFAALNAVLVAFTRVYLGAHFPTDVLAGIVAGLGAGGFSVLIVGRISRIVAAVGETERLRDAYAYLFSASEEGRQPLMARFLRAVIPIGLLLALSAVAGGVLHTNSPRILADYLLNTDNSVIHPLFSRFDLAQAQALYPLLADSRIVYSSLILLALALALLRQRYTGLPAIVVALLLCFAIGYLVEILVAPHFLRARPFEGEVSVAQEWRTRWTSSSGFPDSYLLMLMALSTVVAGLSRGLGRLAYVYTVLVAVGLLYFGATWPTYSIVTLPLGYLLGRHAFLIGAEIFSARQRVGDDHLKTASNHFTSDRSGA